MVFVHIHLCFEDKRNTSVELFKTEIYVYINTSGFTCLRHKLTL